MGCGLRGPFLMSVFSFPAGVNPDVLLRPLFVRDQEDQVNDSPLPSAPAKLCLRRARTPEGQFQPDNPATPENEAWQKD